MRAHQGYEDAINLTISICLTYTLCIAILRFILKRRDGGSDDIVVGIATLFTISNAVANYLSLDFGLGAPSSAVRSVANLNRACIASFVMGLIALYLAKSAMLFFLCRVTRSTSQLRLYRCCLVLIGLLGLISIFAATLGCYSKHGFYWAFHANRFSCPNQSSRWLAITVLDIASEIILLALPIELVWGLQMSLRHKGIILSAFYLRLPVIGLSVGRVLYAMRLRKPHTDPFLASGLVIIMSEIQLAYAIGVSTLSALKAFTESFNSGFGLGFARKGSTTTPMTTTTTTTTTTTLDSPRARNGYPGADDMVIVRETGYEVRVQHDRVPMLPRKMDL
ncbi:hypothetical protein K470DRAFT_278008 [Piedraia hortae CBS 480.64]|uniref:Rhodopsin domain-containing protein n=1 Tax=Piedraia hortae CBS 480.64 TaxID=1314780 RepID=A0A6A7BVK4_9PEZI|nr:hypothetical protein K470DRAFT_278008 [Piedraia hortae CBS 480.64]